MKSEQLMQTTDVTEEITPAYTAFFTHGLSAHHGYDTGTNLPLMLTAASLKQEWPKAACTALK